MASEEDVRKTYHRAMDSMVRLNRVAVRLIHRYNAHDTTDVSGFGLFGHSQMLHMGRMMYRSSLTTCS